MIAVNNGYSSLNAENFERLVVRRCQNTSGITFAICVTIAHHQGDFDSYVFYEMSCKPIKGTVVWHGYEPFMQVFDEAFNGAMGVMMMDQLNPDIWDHRLEPVATIRFVRDDVIYERRAPEVPDSRF